MWRRILFGGWLGFSVRQSQSWWGAGARGCGDKQWLLWGSLSRKRAWEVRLHGHRHRGGVGSLACFHLRPLNLRMRLRRPVCSASWEARLLRASCLGPLCLLGDLRHLAAWWLARLAELGGWAGRRRCSGLCRLHGRGRLCGLRGLSRLQGLALRRRALGLGGRQKGIWSVCCALAPTPSKRPKDHRKRVRCGASLSQPHGGSLMNGAVLRSSGKKSPVTALPTPASRSHHTHHSHGELLPISGGLWCDLILSPQRFLFKPTKRQTYFRGYLTHSLHFNHYFL